MMCPRSRTGRSVCTLVSNFDCRLSGDFANLVEIEPVLEQPGLFDPFTGPGSVVVGNVDLVYLFIEPVSNFLQEPVRIRAIDCWCMLLNIPEQQWVFAKPLDGLYRKPSAISEFLLRTSV